MPATAPAPRPPLSTLESVALANRLRPALLHLARHLRRELHFGAITGGQAEILALVSEHRGIGINELAALVGISPPSMSNAADKLEAAGLLVRGREDPGDRRRVGLTVTAEGLRVVRSARTSRTAWLAERLGRLSAQQLAALDAAVDALEAIPRAGPAG